MSMTPQEIVSELDNHIVGQPAAKRAVAIALRNRWRRQQVEEKLRTEITPKNILMIGPTGVGKTEIARRLARLADATTSLIITGNGDVLEPEDGVIAIGSGGAYAQSAAKALIDNTDLTAEQIVRKSLAIAGEICIYTNMNHTVDAL